MDGICARRQAAPLPADRAEKIALAMANLPTILSAWSEACPNSPKRVVCWIPASRKGLDRLEDDFLTGEIAKAIKEGGDYTWRPFNADTWMVYNPLSRRRWRVKQNSCQCPQFGRAGICKHILAGIIAGVFTVEVEAQAEEIPAAVKPSIMDSRTLSALFD